MALRSCGGSAGSVVTRKPGGDGLELGDRGVADQPSSAAKDDLVRVQANGQLTVDGVAAHDLFGVLVPDVLADVARTDRSSSRLVMLRRYGQGVTRRRGICSPRSAKWYVGSCRVAIRSIVPVLGDRYRWIRPG